MRLPSYFIVHVLVLGLAAGGVCCHRFQHPLQHPETVEVRREPTHAPLPEAAPPEMWVTDGADDGGGFARPMPKEGLKGQKRAPCDPDLEVSINGFCWVRLEGRTKSGKCGSTYFEHEGRCFLPVTPQPRLPTSMEP